MEVLPVLPSLSFLPPLSPPPQVLTASAARQAISAYPRGPSGLPVVAVPVSSNGFILREMTPLDVHALIVKALGYWAGAGIGIR